MSSPELVILPFPPGTVAPDGFFEHVAHGDVDAVRHELVGLVRNLASRATDLRRVAKKQHDDALFAQRAALEAELADARAAYTRVKDDADQSRRSARALHAQELAHERDAAARAIKLAREDAERTVLAIRAEAERALAAMKADAERVQLDADANARAHVHEQLQALKEQAEADATSARAIVGELRATVSALQAALQQREREHLEARCAAATTQGGISAAAKELCAAKDAAIARAQAEADAARTTVDTLHAQLAAALARVPLARTATATNLEKGKFGEATARDLLRAAFHDGAPDGPGFSLKDVSGETPGCGDIHLVLRGVRVRVEVKNYAAPVDRPELDRFRTQVSARPDIAAGIFLSLASSVSGVPELYAEERLVSGAKLFVLCNLLDGDERERSARLRQLKASVLSQCDAWLERDTTSKLASASSAGVEPADASMDGGGEGAAKETDKPQWRDEAMRATQLALDSARTWCGDLRAQITTRANEIKSLKTQLVTAQEHVAHIENRVAALRDGSWMQMHATAIAASASATTTTPTLVNAPMQTHKTQIKPQPQSQKRASPGAPKPKSAAQSSLSLLSKSMPSVRAPGPFIVSRYVAPSTSIYTPASASASIPAASWTAAVVRAQAARQAQISAQPEPEPEPEQVEQEQEQEQEQTLTPGCGSKRARTSQDRTASPISVDSHESYEFK